MEINYIIGITGLLLLMVTVIIEKKSRRKWWLASAIFLVIYNITQRDLINSFVNGWIIIINAVYLAGWMIKR